MVVFCALVFIVLLWFACGFVAAGYTFAYFQRKYPVNRREHFEHDKKIATSDLLLGPVSFFEFFRVRHYGYGWLNPWGKKARKEAGLI